MTNRLRLHNMDYKDLWSEFFEEGLEMKLSPLEASRIADEKLADFQAMQIDGRTSSVSGDKE